MNVNILGLETSQQSCSLALFFAGHLYEYTSVKDQKSSQVLLPNIERLMQQAQCSLSDINAIAFSQGPGSFTGLRVGATVTQALAYAQQIDVLPVSSLRVLAQTAFDRSSLDKVLIGVDARMEGIYWAAFSRDNNDTAQYLHADTLSLAPYDDINAFLQKQPMQAVVGSAARVLSENALQLNTNIEILTDITPSADALIGLAQKFSKPVAAKEIEVVYLRGASAWKTLVDQEKGKNI